MSISRNKNRGVVNNQSYSYVYSDIFQKRGRTAITHFGNANLKFPTAHQISKLTIRRVVWGTGSKYFNLADEFYNDPEYWWVIAFFNLKPLESDNRPGDIILVPTPLTSILRFMGHNI